MDHNGFPIRTKEEMAALFTVRHTGEPGVDNIIVIDNHIPSELKKNEGEVSLVMDEEEVEDGPFVQQYRERNGDVQLDHIEIKSDERQGQTPLICIHGMFDSRLSFK